MLRQMLLGDFVFLIPRRAIDHRDPVRFGPPTQLPAETARHAHQMLVIQSFIGTVGQSHRPGRDAETKGYLRAAVATNAEIRPVSHRTGSKR